MEPTHAVESPWYVRAFDRFYLQLYAHRDDAEARRHAPLLVRLLGVRAGQRVLDAGCGAGRYCRALAARGLRMTGVDLSEPLLAEARERSPSLPGTPAYLRWDLRHLPFQRQFEGALSMFTSFGYFETRAEDVDIMRGVRDALVPGGRLVLDYLNEGFVRDRLVPESVEVRDGIEIRVRRRIDDAAPGGPRVLKEVEARSLETRLVETSYEERVRLYAPAEIDEMLGEGGLVPLGKALGDFDERPASRDAPRYLRVAERPPGR
jgi:SAM-dependent methyltransferase